MTDKRKYIVSIYYIYTEEIGIYQNIWARDELEAFLYAYNDDKFRYSIADDYDNLIEIYRDRGLEGVCDGYNDSNCIVSVVEHDD